MDRIALYHFVILMSEWMSAEVQPHGGQAKAQSRSWKTTGQTYDLVLSPNKLPGNKQKR